MIALLCGGLALVTLSTALIVSRLPNYPEARLTGEDDALGVLWEAPLDDAFEPDSMGEDDQPFFTHWAVTWLAEGSAARADRGGVSAYSLEDGEPIWRFTPEGEGLCTAAEHPAGSAQDIGVVLVERVGGQGRDGPLGNACDTAVGIDLGTGEELWRARVGELWEGTPDPEEVETLASGVGIWSDGPRVVVHRAQTLVGLDADGQGRELWNAQDPLFPSSVEVPGRRSGEPCFQSTQELLLGAGGEAVVHGMCGFEGAVGVLDTATGRVSDRHALGDQLFPSVLNPPVLLSADPIIMRCFGDRCGGPDSVSRLRVVDEGVEEFVDMRQEGSPLEDAAYADMRTGPYVVDGGVLYFSTALESGAERSRIAAIDLASGETLWGRNIEDHRMHGALAVEDGRVLAIASTSTDETGISYARLLAFPAEDEGPVEVIADGLPEMPWSNLRVIPTGGRYVLTLSPQGVRDREGTRNDVAPLYVVG